MVCNGIYEEVMPKVEFVCNYCGHNFVEYLYDLDITSIRCKGCNHQMTDEQIKKEFTTTDVFGYKKDLEYRKKVKL